MDFFTGRFVNEKTSERVEVALPLDYEPDDEGWQGGPWALEGHASGFTDEHVRTLQKASH